METASLEHYQKNENPRKRISKWDLAEDTNFQSKNSNPASDSCQVLMSSSKWDDVMSCNNTVSHVDHSEKGQVKGASEDKIKESYNPIDLEIHAFSPERKLGGSDQNKRTHTSPGHEMWKKHSRSPDYETSSYRSRSRSRSPKRGRKPESDGWTNRNRSTLEGFEHWSTKHTDDYKYRDLRDKRDCKRGKNNRSDYDTDNYESSWKNSTQNDEFPGGKYHRPTFKTRDTKGLNPDENRKAYNEYRRRTACKYFMEGRCRKGSSCRFSHEDSTQRKPEESVADDSWGNRSWVSCEQSGLKSEHVSTNTEKGWGDKWNHNIENESRCLSESKWSKMSGNDNLNKPSKIYDTSKKDHDRILGHNRDLQPRICNSPKFGDRAMEEPIPVISLHHMQQGSNHNKQTCTSHFVQLVPGQSLDINASNCQVNGSNQNLISQSHQSSDYKTPEFQDGSVEKANSFQSQTCVTTSTSSTVAAITTEQVARISSLSGSLSQILGSGSQLPQLYATLNPPNGSILVPFPNILPPATNSYPWSEQQYDPIRDSIQVVVPNTDNITTLDSTKVDVENKNIMEKPSSSTSGFNDDRGDLTGKSNIRTQQDKLSDKIEDTNPMEKNLEVSADVKINDGDDQVNGDNKKNLDAKSLKMFKFALVDFVKDILKPTWKEGNMSKEVHNTIVKKVIEKVSSTVHGPQIPQTQEKISHYLSYCKPKLTKLVQAYVAKYLKS